MKSAAKYLRELSVVIVGIALTFMVSGWINRHREKKEFEEYLHSVKTELKDNLGVLRNSHEIYERTADLAHYLASDKQENLSREEIDRIASHENYYVVNRFFVLTYKKSAMDMLESSGMMRMIRDHELSRSILDCYAMLEALKKESDNYMDLKRQVLYNTIFERGGFDLDLLNPDSRELYVFFSVYVNMEISFQECISQIERTIELIP